MAMQLDEVRFRPAPLSYIKTLYISPGENAMYGAMWDILVRTSLGPVKAAADHSSPMRTSLSGLDEAGSAQSMHLLRRDRAHRPPSADALRVRV